MNIVDALVVTLGLDASGFEKGQKQAQEGLKKTGDEAEKQRKRHEQEAKKSAEAFNTVRDSIMGITAAIVTAVAGGEFLSFLTKNDTAVANLGRNVGTTAQQVGLLEGVFRRMGSSTADAEGFLRTTNKIMEEIKLTGTSGALLPFVQAGLDVAKFRSAASDPQAQLQMLSDAAKKLTPQDAQYRLQAAGYSEGTINILLQNRKALSEVFEEQKKLNVLTQDDINKAFDRQQSMASLGEAFESFGRVIATQVTPFVTAMADAMTKFLVYIKQDGPAAVGIIGLLGTVMATLAGLKMVSWAAAASSSFATVAASASILVKSLGLIGASLGALYELFHLADSVKQLWDIDHRDGVKLSPYAAARLAQGGLPSIGGGSGTLGARNNNPGNLEFAGQTGATRSGRFAAFGSITEGLAALENQLTLDGNRGMTLGQMIAKYAPASDGNNVGAYIADVSKRTGLGTNSRINTSDPKLMQSLIAAMSAHEGNPVDLGSISAGMNLASSRGKGVGPPNITIAALTIKTSASTMTGTGTDLGKGLQNHLYSMQANAGVN